MGNELIKYWTKKSFFYISILWLISHFLFIILTVIIIKNNYTNLITILLIIIINSLIFLILFAFSNNNYTYETVYQIRLKGSTYETKLYRYLITLFSFGWLIFFTLNALFMLINNAVYNTTNDYFTTLNKIWWILLIVSLYNIILIGLHRQLIHYTLTKLELPWSKWKKNKF